MRFLISVSAAAGFLFTGFATPCPGADDLPHYTIHRANSEIKVDGRLDESAWRSTPALGNFQFPWWTEGNREATIARMVWNDECLYVAFQCSDAHISAINEVRDSAVYEDDCVEVFVAPNPDQPGDYFNLEMNAILGVLDSHQPAGPGKLETPNWNARGLLVAVTVDGTLNDDSDTDRGWILEAAIPFENFATVAGKAVPRDGDVWHLNLNRCGGKTNTQYSQWSGGRSKTPNFHTPETFGLVTFSRRTAAEHASNSFLEAGYEPVPDFLKVPNDVTLGPCSAVAVGSNGDLFLFHRGRHPILHFDAEGRFQRAWGDDVIGKAHGLRLDPEGNVWVTDIVRHQVFKFTAAGRLLLAIGSANQAGDSDYEFNQPTDVAFGPAGEVFVTDGYGNSRVVKLDRNGKVLLAWGAKGSGPGQFHLPHAIAIDSRNRVLVGDRENERIQLFDLDGNLLEVWNGFAPYGIALGESEQVLVADGRANQLLRLNQRGEVEDRMGNNGTAAGQFELPHMLAVGPDGSLYVAEVGGQRFQKFRPRRSEEIIQAQKTGTGLDSHQMHQDSKHFAESR